MDIPDTGMEKILGMGKSLTGMIDFHRLFTELKEMEVHLQRGIEDLQGDVKKHKTFLENIPLRFFFKDKNLSYIYCNRNFANDLKKPPEEIAGKTDHDFFPADLAEKFMADDKKVLEAGELENFEETYPIDGQNFIVHMVKAPLRDENGGINGLVGIFWDITKKKAREEEAQRYLAQIEDLLSTRSNELENTNLKLQQENSERRQVEDKLRQTEDFLSTRTDELENTNLKLQQESSERRQVEEKLRQTEDLLSDRTNELENTNLKLQQESSERQQVEDKLRQTEDLLSSRTNDLENTNLKLQQESSERRQVEEKLRQTEDFLSTRTDELENTNLKLQQESSERRQVEEKLRQTEDFLSTRTDELENTNLKLQQESSERRQVEEKLRQTEYLLSDRTDELGKTNLKLQQESSERQRWEERHRWLVERAPIAVGVIQNGLFKFVNPRIIEIFGFSEEELASRTVSEFIHSDDRERIQLRLKGPKDGELPEVFYFWIVRKDGTIRWLENRAALIQWEGSPATINFFSDITERKRAEEELLNAIKPFRALVDNAQRIMTKE